MNLDSSVKLETYIDKTKGSTGADIKAICTEAGMFAIRDMRSTVTSDDFRKAVTKVLSDKKKGEASFEVS
jgi:proteasome regulatory subunit